MTSHMKRLAIILAAFLLTGAFAPGETSSSVDETRGTLRAYMVRLINRDRAIYGLPPVQLDPQLSLLGDEYCRTQIRNRTTGHFTTDGIAPYMRYSFAGVNDGLSENAAAWSANYNFSDRALYEMARRSEDAMMAETPPHDGHKRTILDPHANFVGIGLAWEGGEFRLVHEFVRRYVELTRPLPREAKTGDTVLAAGRPLAGVKIDAITVHYEPMPESMPAHVASALDTYSLPEKREDYLPRLKTEAIRRDDGTIQYIRRQYADGSRGDFYVAEDGSFSFNVPFTEGAGVYTVVVWVRKNGSDKPIAATNVSIRVEQAAYGLGTR